VRESRHGNLRFRRPVPVAPTDRPLWPAAAAAPSLPTDNRTENSKAAPGLWSMEKRKPKETALPKDLAIMYYLHRYIQNGAAQLWCVTKDAANKNVARSSVGGDWFAQTAVPEPETD